MGVIMDYAQLLERSFQHIDPMCGPKNRLQYLAQSVFDFTTYEDEVDELFALKAVEVCAAITDRKTFDYIATEDGRLWYLLMCNMPFFVPRLEWGTSIRGAWWGEPKELQSFWSDTEEQLVEPLRFNSDQWQAFIRSVIAFAAAGR